MNKIKQKGRILVMILKSFQKTSNQRKGESSLLSNSKPKYVEEFVMKVKKGFDF